MSTGDQSVMQGGGAYGANSRPQHVAAAVAYPFLEQAAAEVPIEPPRPIVIGDLGCAGGANEMEPMQRAIDVLRRRDPATPIEVVHTDLPQNDFAPLFTRLASAESYANGRAEVYPRVVGGTLYGPLFPARSLSLVWSGITLHWLSAVPTISATTVYAAADSHRSVRCLVRIDTDDHVHEVPPVLDGWDRGGHPYLRTCARSSLEPHHDKVPAEPHFVRKPDPVEAGRRFASDSTETVRRYGTPATSQPGFK